MGPRNLACAAASSSAGGSPPRRQQIAATEAVFLRVSRKAEEASRARSRKSRAAGAPFTLSTSGAWEGSGTGSGGTRHSRSPRRRRGARLVASTQRPGQEPSSPATSGAAPITCSKLSSTSSISFPLKYLWSVPRGDLPPASLNPRVREMAVTTRPASPNGASATKAAPLGKCSAALRTTSRARRVLPTPPGPASVSRRVSRRRRMSLAASASRSRPRSGVGGVGRVEGVGAVVEGAAAARPGTHAKSEACPLSVSISASASARTVCG